MALLTVAQAKQVLNIPTSDTSFDSELSDYIDSMTAPIEDMAGACTQRTVTNEQHDGGSVYIHLRVPPAQSVTSVTEYWGSYAWSLTIVANPSSAGQYSCTFDAGTSTLVRRTPSGAATTFATGVSNVWVTYVTGPASMPANVVLGAKELLRHLWQMSQNGGRPSYNAPDMTYTPSGYLVPRHVAELCHVGSQRVTGVV